MKICVVSDSHDRASMLAAAAQSAKTEGAAAVLHCGDVIGANTLRALLKIGLPVHVVHGNNLGDPAALCQLAAKSEGMLHYHGQDADIVLAGRRIFLTHYPHYGRAIACTGDYHLVCCGHSHRAEIVHQDNVKGGTTLLVNPGTVAGLGAPATYAIGDLDALSFEIRSLQFG
jgi:uncharacterized protein